MTREATVRDWGARIDRLNNPGRLGLLPPDDIWAFHGRQRVRFMMDLGAGTGLFSLPLARFLPPDGLLLAVDPSRVLAGFMNTRVRPEEPRILPLAAWGHALPVADGFLDLVVMINLYHELSEPSATLREVRRTLRPGGSLLVADWKEGKTAEGPPAGHRVGLDRLAAELRSAGLEPGKTRVFAQHHLIHACRAVPAGSP